MWEDPTTRMTLSITEGKSGSSVSHKAKGRIVVWCAAVVVKGVALLGNSNGLRGELE